MPQLPGHEGDPRHSPIPLQEAFSRYGIRNASEGTFLSALKNDVGLNLELLAHHSGANLAQMEGFLDRVTELAAWFGEKVSSGRGMERPYDYHEAYQYLEDICASIALGLRMAKLRAESASNQT